MTASSIASWKCAGEVPGSIPSQGSCHTKDVIRMVPVVPLFSTQHFKGNIGSVSRTKIGHKCNGSLAIVAGMEKKRMTMQNQQKSNAKIRKIVSWSE